MNITIATVGSRGDVGYPAMGQRAAELGQLLHAERGVERAIELTTRTGAAPAPGQPPERVSIRR